MENIPNMEIKMIIILRIICVVLQVKNVIEELIHV